MARAVLALCVAAVVCVSASATARAATPTTEDVVIAGSGGVQLACQFDLPAGTPPDGGWPGLVLFPGLGGAAPSVTGADFASVGFAAVMCAERGTGNSTGAFDLAGPNDAADAQAIFDWLAARPEVSDTQIGAYGEDLGGAEVWDAAAAGVPFKALVPAEAWSSLARALSPAGVRNTSLYDLLSAEGPTTWDSPAGIAARSYRAHLHALTTPTLIVHDRKNYLADLDQATSAYKLLSGPKRLFIGWAGAVPPETELIPWFQHYLAAGPQTGSGVVLWRAHPAGGAVSYPSLPPTRFTTVNLPGTALQRSVRLTGGPLETFGGGSITIRYSGATWTQVVAEVTTAHGRPVSTGAVPVTQSAGLLKIPLLNEVTVLEPGKRLVVKLTSSDSEFGGPSGGTITVGRVTLKLSLLERAISN